PQEHVVSKLYSRTHFVQHVFYIPGSSSGRSYLRIRPDVLRHYVLPHRRRIVRVCRIPMENTKYKD
ncbi:MAG: hypothetical protein MK125_07655, partial [Dehalococcoidia bacterium]|nr:hypothetical protein [Dehalococcoidia bacterium]